MAQTPGVARALIDSGDVTVAFAAGSDELTESSRFEIGSIVKTMTGTLLATLVVDGTVSLEQPIGTWIDAGPNSGISLAELATHTSGLPRLPPRMAWSRRFRPDDPYAHYDEEALVASLARVRRRSADFVYSNFGFMALGHVLSVIGGDSFDVLLTQRVLEPAGVTGAIFHGEDGVVPGYRNGWPARHWDGPLGGAGGIRASIQAMGRWVSANLAPPGSLADAVRLATARVGDLPVGLGWMANGPDPAMRWHNGGTGGFSSFCGFHPGRGVGVVLLTNEAEDRSLDAQGIAALG